jgi:hypothetical protein
MLVTPADARGLDKVLKLIGKAPAEVTLDLDFSTITPDTRPKGDRGKRGPSRDRDRDRSRGRPESETSVASMEPLTQTAPPVRPPAAPVAASVAVAVAAPRVEPIPEPVPPRNPPRDRHEPRRAEPRAERSSPAPSRRRDDDDGPDVVGFGAELPAFLARAIPVPPAKD